jgi:tetratricopeptide (TPR) repeat protein
LSLLRRVKQAARIRQLRRTVTRLPTPQAYSELAELYIQRGQTDDAHRTALEGLELFPNARRLREVSRFAKRQELQQRIRSLDVTLQHRPHPNAYTELASIYRELGDDERAEEICTRCAEGFPNNENPYLIIGEIRLDRFLDEGLVRDGNLAVENLEKVASLNQSNVKCHLMLARLLHAAGALGRCASHLRSMLSITPTAREIRGFLTEIEGMIAARTEPEESLAILLEKIQHTGRFPNDPGAFPAVKGLRGARREGPVDIDELREGMAQLARSPGIHRAVVLDSDGEVLLESGDVANPTRSVFTNLVTSIGNTAFDLCRRMDIGNLQRSDIEGPFGVIRMARLPGALCCVLAHDARSASGAMDEFIARSFKARKAVDHA